MIIDCRERCVNNVQSIPRWYWVICYREDTATGPIRAVCSWLTMNCGQSRAIPRAAAAAAGAAGPRAPPFGRRRPARATAASRTRTVRDRPPLLIRTLCRYHFPVWRLPTISSSSSSSRLSFPFTYFFCLCAVSSPPFVVNTILPCLAATAAETQLLHATVLIPRRGFSTPVSLVHRVSI